MIEIYLKLGRVGSGRVGSGRLSKMFETGRVDGRIRSDRLRSNLNLDMVESGRWSCRIGSSQDKVVVWSDRKRSLVDQGPLLINAGHLYFLIRSNLVDLILVDQRSTKNFFQFLLFFHGLY